MTSNQSDLDETKRRVAQAGAVLFRLGLADYMGHASSRLSDSELIVIKPRHSATVHALGELKPEQMVTIDIQGQLVGPGDPPPGERFIHTEIYRARPDVGGIVHTHQMVATVFGSVGRPILPILHVEAPLVAQPIPIFASPELINNPERGAEVARTLGAARVCHLQAHGIVTVAPTVEEATVAAIHLERLAKANFMAVQLGSPRVITQDEIERLVGPMVDYQVRWSYYLSLVENKDMPAIW